MSSKTEEKKIEMYVSSNGSRRYVVVNVEAKSSQMEKKEPERRTRNADAIARELFGY
ncbi:hypothetical protein [Pectobacterium versatile]|uniref:hypothetical protein n=1 Tax=Pectobacterium versatile TaxID=2488639 RepID=UPI003823C5DC